MSREQLREEVASIQNRLQNQEKSKKRKVKNKIEPLNSKDLVLNTYVFDKNFNDQSEQKKTHKKKKGGKSIAPVLSL